jgi:hypothetical protein
MYVLSYDVTGMRWIPSTLNLCLLSIEVDRSSITDHLPAPVPTTCIAQLICRLLHSTEIKLIRILYRTTMRISIISASILAIAQCGAAKFAGIKLPENFTPPSINFTTFLGTVKSTHLPSALRSVKSIQLPSLLGPVKSIRRFLQRPSFAVILQDKILELDRKVRAGKEEARQLRVLLAAQRTDRRKSKADEVKRSFEVENVLKEQMNLLSARLEELSGIKGEMEALLKQEKAHALTLETMLESEREEKAALMQKHRDELDVLNEKLMSRLDNRSMEMEEDKKTIIKLTKELVEVRNGAQVSLQEEKMKNLKLEKERQEAQEAVEKEKTKMRKLVKILAEKEKQEVASSAKFKIDTGGASSKKQKTAKVSSQRGRKP